MLHASNVPPNAPGVFIVSSAKSDPARPTTTASLCRVAGARFTVRRDARPPTPQGEASLNVNLANAPFAGLPPGSIRYVQYRFADPTGGPAGFNFSDALELRFRP